ncbi:transposase [Runella sp. MFBS21]|uniref:transposase n=1 Tax=Runella sp. MFBS21 TaxID=3034018 RepID=UPI0023F81362|nr:transposase [Runella sp. MFBS21]MDF7819967.1 transposase [Runella sp. MFBS21]
MCRLSIKRACHKQAGNRKIEVTMNLRLHKEKIREKLDSEEGIRHRKQRPREVEATFGQIKSNHNFKRLRLKGLEKVEIEFGLASFAHKAEKKSLQRCPNCRKSNSKKHSKNRKSTTLDAYQLKTIKNYAMAV